tara:strand:+ start:915 stop:1142 length:228 start_codon:yes stop_codon:yes gene_type:complete
MYSDKQYQDFIEKRKKDREVQRKNDFYKWVKHNNNENKLYSLLNDINKCLENSPYELKDKKLFKDELATFIYYLR